MTLDELALHRKEILWWEVAGLMHDIGKLSDDFLYYRQNWHAMADEWGMDPHDNKWYFDKKNEETPLGDRMLFSEFGELARFFENRGVSRAVNEHTQRTPADPLVGLLKLGDRTDSRYDRNNPLAGNEQTEHEKKGQRHEMFRCDVFGFEGAERRVGWGDLKENLADPQRRPEFRERGILDRARRELYGELSKKLSRHFGDSVDAELSRDEYRDLCKLLKRYFEPAMSDTTRPCNDTSLWEHVYSVASITKALHANHLMQAGFRPDEATPGLFRIWGFGFDALRYLSYAHKIGDVLGRKQVLGRIFEGAERLIQYDYPLGNSVYRDDNCVFFLVADLPELLEEMRGKILEVTKKESEGELVPQFAATPEAVRNLTVIAKCIEDLRSSLKTPIRGNGDWIQSAQGQQGSICPVCRFRIVTESEEKVCERCLKRRNGSAKEARESGQTPYLSEIADDHNRRVAMIVAKFGLERWLNGDMVRTTLITEPHGSEHMRRVFGFFAEKTYREAYEAREEWVKDGMPYSYGRMLGEFRRCLDSKDSEFSMTGFLYGRAFGDASGVRDVWEETRGELGKPSDEDLFNAVCAKTATPSTVLDVWETTQGFLKNVAEPEEIYSAGEGEVFGEVPSLLETVGGLQGRERAVVQVEGDCRGLEKHDSFDTASIDGRSVEAVFLGGSSFAVLAKPYESAWEGKVLSLGSDDRVLRITGEAQTGAANAFKGYKPYRLITASPDLLLLLVPAAAAVEISKAIYERYLERFGKVYGRLPFSIGNIFFPQYLPMFSVLDAARRMERNFAMLHKQPRLLGELKLPPKVDLMLGDGSKDYYHPYVLTAGRHTDADGYFYTMEGPMVSMHAEPKPQDALLYPNYYDCEWLGSSADRLRIHVGDVGDCRAVNRDELRRLVRRPRDKEDGPILLDEFRENVVGLWAKLKDAKPKISDSHIWNFETLMQDRNKAWKDEPGGDSACLGLAAALIRGYFPKDLWEEATQAYEKGFLPLTLKLYLHILKERLGEKDDSSLAASA